MQAPFQKIVWPQIVSSHQQQTNLHANCLTPFPSQAMLFQQPNPADVHLPIPLIANEGWVLQDAFQKYQRIYFFQPFQCILYQTQMSLSKPGCLVLNKQQSIGSGLNVQPQTVPVPDPSSARTCSFSFKDFRHYDFAIKRSCEDSESEIPSKKPSVSNDVARCETQTCFRNVLVESRDRAILKIVESKFSKSSLSKKNFLLKQACQRKIGRISLKSIAALKKIRELTHDEQVVADCIRRSQNLQLREDGMVYTKFPLSDVIDASSLVKSIIAINLPTKKPTKEDVTSLFLAYGDLSQVQILKPGDDLPKHLESYEAWIPDLRKSYCALVEFERQDQAHQACREINIKNRTSESLRVALLKPGSRLKRTLYRKYKDREDSEIQNQSLSKSDDCDETVKQCSSGER